jgi:hypothetical protein
MMSVGDRINAADVGLAQEGCSSRPNPSSVRISPTLVRFSGLPSVASWRVS